MSDHFGDRLAEAVRHKRTPAMVGLDPRPSLLPRSIVERHGLGAGASPSIWARAVDEFCSRLLDIVSPHVPAVKFQSAFFEQHGAAGVASLHRLIGKARRLGLVTILDAKRGDIGSTSQAYAAAAFGMGGLANATSAGLRADALTVSPYLGKDSLEPFLEFARQAGCGIFVLVRTSNPGWHDLQGIPSVPPDQIRSQESGVRGHHSPLTTHHSPLTPATQVPSRLPATPGQQQPSRIPSAPTPVAIAVGSGLNEQQQPTRIPDTPTLCPVYTHVAAWVRDWSQATLGRSGFGSVGAVVGGTAAEQIAELRQALPNTWLLIPGYGAQGATAADIATAFDADGLGAVVNNSRGILFPKTAGDPLAPSAWEPAVEAALKRMIHDLGQNTPAGRLQTS